MMRSDSLALTLSLGLALLGGCAGPAERFAEKASALGFGASRVEGESFAHVLYRPAGPRPDGGRVLHVYLDGDGTPWERGGPAADPTPREALVLRLMALDPVPSLYLGRPCYHGLAAAPPCAPALWTDARYSEVVVVSMAAAARRLLSMKGHAEIVWLGYSGGGALAMLLAARIPETAGVVTVAANLDVDAWAEIHSHSRLAGSLNPARRPPLPPRIYQRHYAGGRDQVVPPGIVAGGGIPPESLRVIPEYDHVCCWVELWPRVLDEAERAAVGRR
jgi:pimeloyl-ACP methyl ester carboxylesterase